MRYEILLRAHTKYQSEYSFDGPYGEVLQLMRGKKRVSKADTKEILGFLNKWQCRIPKSPEAHRRIRKYYNDVVLPGFAKHSRLRIERVDLVQGVVADGHRVRLSWLIHNTYDKLFEIECRVSNTAISKMLHIVCPGLFVMWDVRIREHYVGYNNACGYEFAFKYLPEMKEEITQAIETYRKKHGGSVSGAARTLSNQCDGRSLAKLADEYNYLKYTAKQRF